MVSSPETTVDITSKRTKCLETQPTKDVTSSKEGSACSLRFSPEKNILQHRLQITIVVPGKSHVVFCKTREKHVHPLSTPPLLQLYENLRNLGIFAYTYVYVTVMSQFGMGGEVEGLDSTEIYVYFDKQIKQPKNSATRRDVGTSKKTSAF
ncbi:hypothetical protein U1Q18_050992 [Sarracenia purpurea var. burkii]